MTPIRHLLLCLIAAMSLFGQGSHAQTETAVLLAPWVEVPPNYEFDDAGRRSGFLAEMAQEIGDEAGFEVAFVPAESIRSALDSVAVGETQIIAGMVDIPSIAETTVASDPVAISRTYLFVRSGEFEGARPEDFDGLRVGYFTPLGDALDIPELDGAESIAFDNWYDLLVALVIGQIDAAAAEQEHLLHRAREMGLQTGIEPRGPPLRERTRRVVLHESEAGRLEQINAAIAALEENGRLPQIRHKYFMDVVPEIPDVLTVGVVHFPPFQIVGESGEVSGFAIEAIREIAARAALQLDFRVIDLAEFEAGPSVARYDLLPQIGVTPARAERMLISLPINSEDRVSIFVRDSDDRGIESLDDLEGLRVGVRSGNAGAEAVERHGTIIPVVARDIDTLLQMLADGEVDAVVATALAVGNAVSPPARVIEIQSPVSETVRAVGLRFGLGPIEQRINSVIPGYLISDTYRDTRERWFGEPVYWTQARILGALGAVVAIAAVTILAVIFASIRQRQAALRLSNASIAAVNAELIRSNRDLDNFAYVASHDLKEPLRGITINANFMLKEDLPKDIRKRATRMIELCVRMEKLISDLLFFSRLGQTSSVTSDSDVKEIAASIKDIFEELQDPSIARIEVQSALPTIQADPAHIRTIFQNLISNGLIYNTSRPKIINIGYQQVVHPETGKTTQAFFVRDNGIGIDPKFHQKVFDIFTRLNLRSSFDSGSGAGLAFVKRVVERYGGTIWISSEESRGTTFYFTLPTNRDRETQPRTKVTIDA